MIGTATTTGTGAVVLANSPVIAGTITAGNITTTTSLSLQNHYAQLSSSVTQAPGTTSPTLVLMDTNNEIAGLTHSTVTNTGSITVNKSGIYVLYAGGQVGKTGAGGTTFLDLWFRKNGTDIPNSNVRNSLAVSTDTKVVITQCAILLNAGDYINVMQSVDNAAVGCGLYCTAPAGEPVIPSIILTMYEL